jgi:serine/threonine protein kinase
MKPPLWKTITPSDYPWEQEALEFIREGLPDHEPYRAWGNFEFIGDDGSINEVDLLVHTPQGVFLVEIKSRPGAVSGDSATWTFESAGRRVTTDSPLVPLNRKAKKLKSLLERQKACRKGKARLPFIEPLIFLSAPELELKLAATARHRLCLRDLEASGGRPARPGIVAALTQRQCEGLEPARSLCDRVTAKMLAQALEQAGIRPSQRSRRVSDYVLEFVLMEGPGYQDWQAAHVQLKDVRRRVRLYLVQTGASAEMRQTIERAARREYRLLETLHHSGVLRALAYTEHELGPALIFEHDPASLRLDHYLEARGTELGIAERLEILRQVAEVVQFAHQHKVVHRTLGPHCILIRDAEGKAPKVKVMNWQGGYRIAGSTATGPGSITPTTNLGELLEDASTAYLAPEAFQDLDPEAGGEHLDLFSLGALAYFLFSGKAPAANACDLAERLRGTMGLKLSSVLNGAPEDLEFLIECSTHPEVYSRLDSAADFLRYLDGLEEKLTRPGEEDVVDDPSRAQKGDRLPGGLTVKRRLGKGANSIVFLVERGGEDYVLKVAIDAEHDERIAQEGEVLKKLRHQHIIEYCEIHELGARKSLLLRSAGAETLGERLRKEGPLHVELLERFGEDLLEALVYLEEQGVQHRDIKPDNIALGPIGRGDRLHLVLFDFSLASTPPENIRAGTTGYLDPFLPERSPKRWDLYAERYAAAVTLHELATGRLPRWGDGVSEPSQLACEATIDPELFDPSLRDALSQFFQKALRRRPEERFDNAEEMLRAWRRSFAPLREEERRPEEAGAPTLAEELEKAGLHTHIAELPLGTRARNALDRVNVLTVEDLLRFPFHRLARLRGVGNKTRREIGEALKVLRARLGAPPARDETREAATRSLDTAAESVEAPPPVQSLDLLARRLAQAEGGSRGEAAARAIPLLLGLEGDLGAWAAQAEVAEHLGVSRARIGQVAAKAVERWKRDPALTSIRGEIPEVLAAHGGALSVADLAAALLLSRGSAEPEPLRTRRALAVSRAACEVERAAAEPRFLVRRSAGKVLVAESQEAADHALRLGLEADAIALEDPLLPPARALERLRGVAGPAGRELLADARLLRLAVAASTHAALSSRQELYPRGMSAARALKLSLGALLGAQRLSVDELRERVSGRYAEAEPLPARPELDLLLAGARIELEWDPSTPGGGSYVSRPLEAASVSSETRKPPRLPTLEGPSPPPEPTAEVAAARHFEERIERSLEDGGFIALTVEPGDYEGARAELLRRFALEELDLEGHLLDGLRRAAQEAGARWEVVLKADREPGGSDWPRLLSLVRRAVPRLEERIAAATRPLLLIYPGLLARYEQMDLLERLRDRAGKPGGPAALWVLIPSDDQRELPVLEGKPVPVIGPGQRARIPSSWIHNNHRGGIRGGER